jgi:hypothetical protein
MQLLSTKYWLYRASRKVVASDSFVILQKLLTDPVVVF